MTPERIAELRAVASETEHGPFGWLTGTGLAGTWHEMLDEIEQLQEANRWRDPAVELPEGNRHVISSDWRFRRSGYCGRGGI